MRTWHWTTARESDPPSTVLVVYPERESDRLMVAELCDQAGAGRAPAEEIRQKAVHGRIFVTSFAAELGIRDVKDGALLGQLPQDVQRVVLEAASALWCHPQDALRFAFCVRFLWW